MKRITIAKLIKQGIEQEDLDLIEEKFGQYIPATSANILEVKEALWGGWEWMIKHLLPYKQRMACRKALLSSEAEYHRDIADLQDRFVRDPRPIKRGYDHHGRNIRKAKELHQATIFQSYYNGTVA